MTVPNQPIMELIVIHLGLAKKKQVYMQVE